MKMGLAIVLALWCCAGCDSTTASTSTAAEAGEKMVAHGYRKYVQQQYVAAHKAYLEAYFIYKDAGIEPTSKLYSGMSALTIRSIEKSPNYPLTTQVFVVGQQESLTIGNEKDLIKASVKYLEAALALSIQNSSDSEALDELHQCHTQRLKDPSSDCQMINESLFAYPLD